MAFLDLFKNKEKRAKLNHLKSLVAIAVADGILKKEELAAISIVMQREGLTVADLEYCIKHPTKHKFVVPKNNSNKILYLKDMVRLMMIDGNIDGNEMLVCKLTAEAFGYRGEIVDAIIAEFLSTEIEVLNS